GSNAFSFGNLMAFNGTLFFTMHVLSGIELWKSDGTSAGTVMIKSVNAATYAESFTPATNVFYFITNDLNGYELWKSDGTPGGTVLVKDIYNGSGSSTPQHLTNINGVLYFSADDGIHGYELWRSDGTAGGTVLVKDINNGSSGSSPNNLTNVNGTLYFSSDNGINGRELWKSNGTSTGTVLVKDIWNGSGTSSVDFLTNVNGKLFFVAQSLNRDGFDAGAELWSLGSCTPGNSKVTETKGVSGGVWHNSEQQTTPATLNCGCDILNNLIVSVNAQGANPVSGEIQSKVWIDTAQSTTYVKRHYEVNPQNNPATSTGKITLYFTQQEFTGFNAVAAKPLPANATDAIGKSNMRVVQRRGTGDEAGSLASYTGAVTIIDPLDADIIWNSTDSRWEVSFETNGFGGFWVSDSINARALPVSWISFTAKLTTGNKALLNWKVSEKNTISYEVERSGDGASFELIANTRSAGNGTNNYMYTDEQAFANNDVTYYRIRQVDANGSINYSKTAIVRNEILDQLLIYPNPFSDKLVVQSNITQDMQIMDITGKIVLSQVLKVGDNDIQNTYLPAGFYILKAGARTYKIIKQ
ncbi:MAG: ELWxxDGT repeat protein, partial [Bacteroidota bacterium]